MYRNTYKCGIGWKTIIIESITERFQYRSLSLSRSLSHEIPHAIWNTSAGVYGIECGVERVNFIECNLSERAYTLK